jgi:hypothetical protein
MGKDKKAIVPGHHCGTAADTDPKFITAIYKIKMHRIDG